MGVALDASKCNALPGLPDGANAIEHGADTKLFVVRAPLFIGLRQPIRGGCYQVGRWKGSVADLPQFV